MKKKLVTHSAATIFNTVDGVVDSVERRVDSFVAPVRTSAFERFPTLFTLLASLGVVATMRGLDLVLQTMPSVYHSPLLLLSFGIGILVLTGTLYKKLG
jgi:hypothetical protein